MDIIYEDDYLIVINKPSNLVVHPGAGNPDGTLLNALLHYYPPIANVPRTGIVHRLDKNTTGLMIIAKTIPAHTHLIKLLKLREISREYEAIVIGHIRTDSKIQQPIGRHCIKRTHMSVHPKGKPAITHYSVIENFRAHTHLRIRLETGRTHQIRVHMAYLNHPLVGDKLYGGYPHRPIKGISEKFISVLYKFKRQALHAATLRINHLINNVKMEWHAPIPQDMKELIEVMHTDFNEYKDNIN